MGSTRYDCLGVHSYSTPPADGTLTRYDALQAGAADRDAELRELRNRMASYFPRKTVRPDLLVTEYGVVNVGEPAYEARLGHTLYLAAQMAGQLENDVRVSINSNTADLPKGTGTTDSAANLLGSSPFFTTARSLMLRMFAEMAGGRVVRSSVKRNPTLGSATGHYAALRVVTSCTDDVLRTVVVNRDAQQPVATRLSLPRPVAGRVDVSTVNGASIESFNIPEHPDDVRPGEVARRGGRRHAGLLVRTAQRDDAGVRPPRAHLLKSAPEGDGRRSGGGARGPSVRAVCPSVGSDHVGASWLAGGGGGI